MCKELRNDMLKKRKHMLQSDIEEKSNIISKKLFDFNEYKNAKTLFLYINFGSEVITKNIIIKNISNIILFFTKKTPFIICFHNIL